MLISISGDYTDAISLGNKIYIAGDYSGRRSKECCKKGWHGNGHGGRNSCHGGMLPDLYLQAVGSGTGGIAAYEASLRLIADGRFGRNASSSPVSE